MTRQDVVDRFREFSVRFEGLVHWPYLDIKGLVTVGIGCLIDPAAAALALPWVLEGSGEPASKEQVLADWNNLKSQQRLSKLHFNYARPVTKIRLTEEGVDTLLHQKMAGNEAYMKKRLPAFATWPADDVIVCVTQTIVGGCPAVRTFDGVGGRSGLGRHLQELHRLFTEARLRQCRQVRRDSNRGEPWHRAAQCREPGVLAQCQYGGDARARPERVVLAGSS